MAKLTLGLFVAFTIVAAGQDQPAQFRTSASFIRVDVFPTAKGVPVDDLKQDDFEILEDKVPQRIASFEHVVVQTHVPEEARREPATLTESRAAVATTRGRVWVLFLDVYHVEGTGSQKIRQPLVDLLDHALGEGDLLAVMVPGMSARDLTFVAKTRSVAAVLDQVWGRRDRIDERDPEDANTKQCYPLPPVCPGGLADEIIDRRRETKTLDALRDLVEYLRDVREERKAVLTVTDGWRLFEPNPRLPLPIGVYCSGPTAGTPPLGTDPRNGRIVSSSPPPGAFSESQCEIDRMRFANIDDYQRMRDIGEEANRANVSFYPIDPRGLVASDQAMQPPGLAGVDMHTAPISPKADVTQTDARLRSLRTLALDTDGTAIVATNDIPGALRRVAADLSSYYLLGYASTGKLDGKFHAITVRVRRPGVDVRARRGFLAATPTELAAAVPPAPPALAGAVAAEASAVASALAPLALYTRDAPVRVQAMAGWNPDGTAAIWIVGDVGGEDWRGGGQADAMLVAADGQTLATSRIRVAAGDRSFRERLSTSTPVAPGDYTVAVRSRGAADAASPSTDSVRLHVATTPEPTGALFVHRGPTTQNKDLPTADARFRRTEQLRVEVPTPDGTPWSGRLLDRTGQPLSLPVSVTVRDDADGARWQTAQLSLAPLGPGDYLVELTRTQAAAGASETKRTLVAFRVVP